jgi:hypothetical protein
MLLCSLIDLDLIKEVDAYINAKETIKYLQDVVDSIEARLLKGEPIEGLEITEGQKRRYLTDYGLQYLENKFGREFTYKTIEKPITITELEKELSQYEMVELAQKGVIDTKSTTAKVAVSR